MVIVSYDISDNKLRTRFSKFLEKFGYRLQYSVFKIKNSPSILDNIVTEIKNEYEDQFDQRDSVMIFQLSKTCKQTYFGYADNMDKPLLIIE